MKKALLSIYFQSKQLQHFTLLPIQHHNNNVVKAYLKPILG